MLSMKLTRNERSELAIEAIITLGLIFFLYLSALFIYRESIDYRLDLFGLDTTLRQLMGLTHQQIIVSVYIFSLASLVVAGLVTNWRVQRRVKQMKLRHVLAYLKHMAQGNYDIRIPETEFGEMADVISSINHLVESTVHAMEEERRIEKSKDELITNIGHDIRTPLTSIIGYLGLIENQQYQSQQDMLDYAHIAYNKAQQMQRLINDLFAYTASRQVTATVTPTTIQMQLFLEQLAADFEIAATEKQIELEVEVTPKQLEATFDVDLMARVFHNLITNALKYGEGARYVRLVAKRQETQLVLEVINDGQPIPRSELEHIFQRSYRADKSRNADQAGSGLGLSIVKNIVELHQGKVEAIVKEQETIFQIILPQIN